MRGRARIPLRAALACLGNRPHQTAFEFQIIGPRANPFALNWFPVTPQDAPTAQVLTVDQRNLQQLGDGLHPGDTADTEDGPEGLFHHISIEPLGEVLFPFGTPHPDPVITQQVGNAATLLKARVSLLMGNARERSFDLDIGAGAEFAVKAQRVLDITPLVPDPNDPLPTRVGADGDSFSVVILTTIYCGLYPTPCCMRQRYTQPFDLGTAGVTSAVMPVMPAARDAMLEISPATVGAGQADLTFIYAFAPEIDTTTDPPTFIQTPIVAAYGTPSYAFVTLGSVTISNGESSTPMVPIPNGANAILFNNSAGGTGSVIQFLNV